MITLQDIQQQLKLIETEKRSIVSTNGSVNRLIELELAEKLLLKELLNITLEKVA